MDRSTLFRLFPSMPVLGLALLLALAPTSAPAKDKEIVAQFIRYDLVSSSSADSVNGLTFELQGLWGSPNDVPDLFAFTRDELIAARIGYRQRRGLPPDAFVLRDVEEWFPKAPQGLRWINSFLAPDGRTGLFAFRVTAHNRSTEPVRMRDARVYLRTSEGGEAVPPSPDLGFYERWILGKEVAMNNRKEGPLAEIQPGFVLRHVPYPVGVAGAILAQKVPSWSAMDLMGKEVPAGASGTGFLLFPAELGADSVSVTFAPAQAGPGAGSGSPQTIEFKFRKEIVAYWWEKAQRRWVAGEKPTAGK